MAIQLVLQKIDFPNGIITTPFDSYQEQQIRVLPIAHWVFIIPENPVVHLLLKHVVDLDFPHQKKSNFVKSY